MRPNARRRWILDPIDGTKSFIRRVPLWGTLVAVTEGESVLAGCAYFPAVAEIVAAATGEGCFWNGTALQRLVNRDDCRVDHRDNRRPVRRTS